MKRHAQTTELDIHDFFFHINWSLTGLPFFKFKAVYVDQRASDALYISFKLGQFTPIVSTT